MFDQLTDSQLISVHSDLHDADHSLHLAWQVIAQATNKSDPAISEASNVVTKVCASAHAEWQRRQDAKPITPAPNPFSDPAHPFHDATNLTGGLFT